MEPILSYRRRSRGERLRLRRPPAPGSRRAGLEPADEGIGQKLRIIPFHGGLLFVVQVVLTMSFAIATLLPFRRLSTLLYLLNPLTILVNFNSAILSHLVDEIG